MPCHVAGDAAQGLLHILYQLSCTPAPKGRISSVVCSQSQVLTIPSRLPRSGAGLTGSPSSQPAAISQPVNNYHLGEGGEILSLSPVLTAECSTHTEGPGGDGALAGPGYTGLPCV